MSLLVLVFAAVVALALGSYLQRRSRRKMDEAVKDTSPAIDTWIADALENELAESALGMRGATPEERRILRRTLRGDPDPDVVSRIEDAVRIVELEFVRYAHEQDTELTVRVRYENGGVGTSSLRIPWSEVPEAIRADFERRSSSRVFRTWTFPWARVHVM
jgi:hypothetical protein